MRVLIVTGIFPPDTGGPANYVPAIAEALSRDHQVIGVVTLSDTLDHDDAGYAYPVVRLLRGESRLRRQWRTMMTIRRLLKTADVVYLNGLVLEGVVAARLLAHRPVVVKVVGDLIWEQARNNGATTLDIDDFQSSGGKPVVWKALRWLQGVYTGGADRVIVPSRYLGRIVRGWGVPSDKVAVVFNAVKPPEAETDQLLDHDVVTVARLVSWKGIDRLIEVCALKGWSLLIVGDGPSREDLEALAARLGARVTFTGQIPKAGVAGQIRRARVFVLNSTYEGLPHIVLEAKLAGRPVVATAVGGTPETIHHGVDGYLVDVNDNGALGDALSRLLDDESHRLDVALAGLEDARARFTFDVMYDQTVAVLEQAAAHG